MAGNNIERRTFKAGEFLFREGDEGEEAFILESGSVRLSKAGQALGQSAVADVIRMPGELFGALPLVDKRLRQFNAMAEIPTEVFVITQERFQARLDDADPFVKGFVQLLVKNVRTMSDRLSKGGHIEGF